MQLAHMNTALVHDVADRMRDVVSEPDWSQAANHATARAAELANDAAHRSADVGARAGERLREVAAEVADHVQDKFAVHSPAPQRHRVRNTIVLVGVVGLAAYVVKSRRKADEPRPSSDDIRPQGHRGTPGPVHAADREGSG